jgi:hypothetical protein
MKDVIPAKHALEVFSRGAGTQFTIHCSQFTIHPRPARQICTTATLNVSHKSPSGFVGS